MKLFIFIKNIFLARTTKIFTKIIAANVIGIGKHPNADRLKVIKLSDGSKEIYPVVCGAFNFGVGDMVALALPGAMIKQTMKAAPSSSPPKIGGKLKGGHVLQKAKIRGVESQGMICAGFELGLSDKPDEGILILKNDVKPGSQFNQEMIK